jgi:hypothetical protein
MHQRSESEFDIFYYKVLHIGLYLASQVAAIKDLPNLISAATAHAFELVWVEAK